MKKVEITVMEILNLFRIMSVEGRVPLYLPGDLFVKHFELSTSEKSGELYVDNFIGWRIDYFFNKFCYDLKVLTINPGTDEASYHWQQNDFGLEDSYFTQLQRELKINDLGI